VVAREVTIVNRLGLHARASAKFVQLASRFDSQITVSRLHQAMDGKSIMGVLLLAAARDTRLTIAAEGPDEAAAVDALCRLVESGFDEDLCSA
jgi:phosphocarrier protein